MLEGVAGDGEAPCVTTDPLYRLDKVMDPGWTVDRKGVGSPHEREGLNETEYAEKVIRVPVSDEDGVHGKTGPGAHHLLLSSFTAVKEQGIGTSPDQNGGRVSLRRWEGAGCAEEVDVQGLAGYTNHFLNAVRLRLASSSVRPSITTAPE